MTDSSDLIAEFMSITCCDVDVAAQCLREHGNNLQLAIDSFMSGWKPTAAGDDEGGDDGKRAPIPVKEDQVLQPDDLEADDTGKKRSGTQKFIFDAFRNFRADAGHDDDDDENEEKEGDGDGDDGKRSKMKGNMGSKLASRFSRPTDIAIDGTLEEACKKAVESGVLLVVNIQDVKEFASHVLNRDVWSDIGVRACLRQSYALWQCGSDCEDAKSFLKVYKLDKLPCICVLDPLTGELIKVVDVPITSCVANADAVAKQLKEVARSSHVGVDGKSTKSEAENPGIDLDDDIRGFSSDEFEEESDENDSDDGDDDHSGGSKSELVTEPPAKKARQDDDCNVACDVPEEIIVVQIRILGRQPLVINFNANQTVEKLIGHIKEQINQQDERFSLFSVYPRRELRRESTLKECGIKNRTLLALEKQKVI